MKSTSRGPAAAKKKKSSTCQVVVVEAEEAVRRDNSQTVALPAPTVPVHHGSNRQTKEVIFDEYSHIDDYASCRCLCGNVILFCCS